MMQTRYTELWVQTPSDQICPEKEDLVKDTGEVSLLSV